MLYVAKHSGRKTAYLMIACSAGRYRMDDEEKEDVVGSYQLGFHYFCWVDPEMPSYVVFRNDEHWSDIAIPLACVLLVLPFPHGFWVTLWLCRHMRLFDDWRNIPAWPCHWLIQTTWTDHLFMLLGWDMCTDREVFRDAQRPLLPSHRCFHTR